MIRILNFPADTIDDVWPVVEGWLEKCLKVAPPWWRMEDLKASCKSGQYILLLATVDNQPEGVALAEIIQFPAAKVCNVPWIGGNKMRAWFPDLQEQVEAWAEKSDAKYLLGGGREGWKRIVGMENYGCILIKELPHGKK